MGLFVQSNLTGLTEPAPVPEVTCGGLARIEFLGGGLACFVLYRNSVMADSGEMEPQVCGRIFAPLEAIPAAIELMMMALIESGSAIAVEWGRRKLAS